MAPERSSGRGAENRAGGSPAALRRDRLIALNGPESRHRAIIITATAEVQAPPRVVYGILADCRDLSAVFAIAAGQRDVVGGAVSWR